MKTTISMCVIGGTWTEIRNAAGDTIRLDLSEWLEVAEWAIVDGRFRNEVAAKLARAIAALNHLNGQLEATGEVLDEARVAFEATK
jgi:hypothetical protein